MKNVVLTGGTGFLGTHLLTELLKHGYEVSLATRSSSQIKLPETFNYENLKRVNVDVEPASNLFTKKVDAIVHAATNYGRKNSTIYDVLNSNLALPLELHELAMKNEVPLYINTDSYFNKNHLSYRHLTNYSLSKKALVNWLSEINSKVNVVNLRLEHIYGPLDRPEKFISLAIDAVAIKKVKFFATTFGNQKRDFVFVSDVVNAYLEVLKKDFPTTVGNFIEYEIGTGQSTEVREVLEIIKELSKSQTEIGFGSIPYRSDEIMDSKSNQNFRIDFNWEPKISIIDGIQTTIKAMQKSI